MAIQGLAYIPGAVLGGIQAISSYQKLKELQKQSLPTYNLQPAQQNVQMYEQRFRQGLSPEERAAMQQQFSSQQAGMYRAASDQSRGQLSSFLGRVSAFDRIKQATQLGSMMASERRAAMSGLAGARQGLESQMNRQTSMDYSRRMAEEQALGGALKAGTENIGDALTMGLHTGLTKQSIYDQGLTGEETTQNTDNENMETPYRNGNVYYPESSFTGKKLGVQNAEEPDNTSALSKILNMFLSATPEEKGLNITARRFAAPAVKRKTYWGNE
jgi:hypothetical protein